MRPWVVVLGVALECAAALSLADGRARKGHDQVAAQSFEDILISTGDSRRNRHRSVEGGKLHFLLLANGSIPLLRYWTDFLESAPETAWQFWVHNAEPDVELSLPRGFVQVPTVPSAYCLDLVSPMAQLAKEATANSTSHGHDKFIYVSDSTLPVKPFDFIYEELTATNNSDVGINSVTSVPGHFNGIEVFLMKHSQWVVLNRRHALMLGQNWKPVQKTPPYWSNPFDTKLGTEVLSTGPWVPASSWTCPTAAMLGDRVPLLALHRDDARRSAVELGCGLCTDEFAIVPTFLGSFVKSESGETDYPDFGTVRYNNDSVATTRQGVWRTFVTFANVDYADPPIEDSFTLAWKPEIHPWTFYRVGNVTASALRRSHYLFARKFAEDTEIPGFKSIMLSPDF